MAQKKSNQDHFINLNDVRIATRRILGVEKLAIEIEDELSIVVARSRKLLGALAKATSASSIRQQQLELRRIEQSNAAKLVAFILANGRGNFVRKMRWVDVKAKAIKINPRRPTDEYALLNIKQKPNGGSREICSFGPVARGTQKLIEQMILNAVGHSCFEHARKGCGREVAIRRTLQSIKMKGVRWFGLLDVKDFFTSITREMVKDALGFLPMSYIEASLFIHKETEIRHKRLYKDDTNKSSEAAIRNGLPQGSLASILVASKVLEKHLEELKARHAISHVDDVLIGGNTEKEVHAKIDALATSLEWHHSGSLHLTGKAYKIGDDQMHYLGYRFRRRSQQFGGFGRATFSERSRQNFHRRLSMKLIFSYWQNWNKIIDKECARWVRSFPSWDNRIECEDFSYIDVWDNLVPSVELVQKIMTHTSVKWNSLIELEEFRVFAARVIAESASRNFTTGGDLNLKKLNALANAIQVNLAS